MPCLATRIARAGNNKCGGRGNIKGSGRISSRAAGIDQHFAVCSGECRADGDLGPNGRGFRPNYLGKPDQFVHGLALHAQTRQECGNLGVRGLAGHDFVHERLGLGPAEVLAFYNSSNTVNYVHCMEYIRSIPKIRSQNRIDLSSVISLNSLEFVT